MRRESGDAGLVQLFDRLQPPAAHRQRIHKLPHLLLTQVNWKLILLNGTDTVGLIPVEGCLVPQIRAYPLKGTVA